jgi:hypothetical protein
VVATATRTIGVSGGTVAGGSGGLAVVVKANASYPRPKGGAKATNATLATTVTSAGSPQKGAAVSVQVRDPLGAVKTLSATTGPNGVANVNYPVASNSAVGNYTVTSTVTMGSASGSATTSFAVK